jgi:hypothetical protein
MKCPYLLLGVRSILLRLTDASHGFGTKTLKQKMKIKGLCSLRSIWQREFAVTNHFRRRKPGPMIMGGKAWYFRTQNVRIGSEENVRIETGVSLNVRICKTGLNLAQSLRIFAQRPQNCSNLLGIEQKVLPQALPTCQRGRSGLARTRVYKHLQKSS